jgi:hypothetical protein
VLLFLAETIWGNFCLRAESYSWRIESMVILLCLNGERSIEMHQTRDLDLISKLYHWSDNNSFSDSTRFSHKLTGWKRSNFVTLQTSGSYQSRISKKIYCHTLHTDVWNANVESCGLLLFLHPDIIFLRSVHTRGRSLLLQWILTCFGMSSISCICLLGNILIVLSPLLSLTIGQYLENSNSDGKSLFMPYMIH